MHRQQFPAIFVRDTPPAVGILLQAFDFDAGRFQLLPQLFHLPVQFLRPGVGLAGTDALRPVRHRRTSITGVIQVVPTKSSLSRLAT